MYIKEKTQPPSVLGSHEERHAAGSSPHASTTTALDGATAQLARCSSDEVQNSTAPGNPPPKPAPERRLTDSTRSRGRGALEHVNASARTAEPTRGGQVYTNNRQTRRMPLSLLLQPTIPRDALRSMRHGLSPRPCYLDTDPRARELHRHAGGAFTLNTRDIPHSSSPRDHIERAPCLLFYPSYAAPRESNELIAASPTVGWRQGSTNHGREENRKPFPNFSKARGSNHDPLLPSSLSWTLPRGGKCSRQP